jgi:membrane-associated phospholipid phosphatase
MNGKRFKRNADCKKTIFCAGGKDLFVKRGKFFAYFCAMYGTALTVSLWQRLEDWDKWLFIKLNSQWTNPVFDTLLPYFRDPVFWVPVYLFVLVFISLNFGKKGIWWSLAFVCTIAITDLVGARVFKEGFQRLRPCYDPEFSFHVRLLLKQCSSSYSFVSNHAANHFGMATFAVLTFRGIFKKWMYLAYVWAFFIAYAQIYVGVHYPLDILGGAVLGMLAGSLTAWLYHKKWGSFNFDQLL